MNELSPTSNTNSEERTSVVLQNGRLNAVNRDQQEEHEDIDNNNNNSSNTNTSIDDDAMSQMTEINIAPTPNSSSTYNRGFFLNDNPVAGDRLWTNEERDAYEERRRVALTAELTRVQRTNFIHFLILCLIPIGLVGLVLLNSFQGDEGCEGYGSVVCLRERRDFRNAFSNKCVCTAFQLEG
mmetsp:Transcript_2883/g.3463  ORF Transcript_2883/g.3463 Transcript_2883/m.3463 type:complete len:182 (-) Transcript_2883:177-722(-)